MNPQPSTLHQAAKLWLPIALFSILWLDLIRLLSGNWEAREQYAYGWFVPFLALALLWRRWLDRPQGAKAESRKQKTETGPARINFYSLLSIFLLCLLLLPLRVIFEINTDWPLIAWIYTIIVVTLTLYAFHLAGPRFPLRLDRGEGQGEVSRCSSHPQSFTRHTSLVSPWVAHFAFPVCFILVALVWPYRIEKGLTQNLMQTVATLTVEIIGWLGVPAVQRGNLIEVTTGVVGVDEACSGIRSFQSTLMAALFLGELYRLKWPLRLGLLIGGVIVSFGLNVVRTLFLTWQADAHGLTAIDKYHDSAGMSIFLISFACLWGLAVLIKRKAESKAQAPECGPQKAGSERNFQLSAFSISAFPRWRRYAAAIGLYSLLCLGATELWYRSHANPNAGVFHWTAVMPESNPTYEKIELPPRTLKLLSYDEGASGKWMEDGAEWSAHFFRWNPRSIESVITSRIHRPERCLPASGLKQISESELVGYEAGRLNLPFRKYVFQGGNQTLFVFFCQWEDGSEQQAGLQSSNQEGRLQSVWNGRRLVGQQTLQLILTGYPSLDAAQQAVAARLPSLIRVETQVAVADRRH